MNRRLMRRVRKLDRLLGNQEIRTQEKELEAELNTRRPGWRHYVHFDRGQFWVEAVPPRMSMEEWTQAARQWAENQSGPFSEDYWESPDGGPDCEPLVPYVPTVWRTARRG